MKTLTISNRSRWPDWAIKDIVTWVVKRAGITWQYNVQVKHTTLYNWKGRGGLYGQRIWLPRRFQPESGWPLIHSEWRYKDAGCEFVLRSRLELLVYLLAHEAHHATGGNRSKFKTALGRIDRRAMEIECNEEAAIAVQQFRIQFPDFVKRWRFILKRQAVAESPTVKIAQKRSHIARKIEQWESRAKRAANAMKKYRKQLRYYDGRLAALKGCDIKRRGK